MRAYVNLRYTVKPRVDAFMAGLNACGFQDGGKCSDLMVTWNRIGEADSIARTFEAHGKPVIVAENAIWGNEFLDGKWHSLALGRHNTAGRFPVGGPERWDSLGVNLDPWRTEGETVVLGQRGIGAYGMPRDWPEQVKPLGRYRAHPGRSMGSPLHTDLKHAQKVITWGSGAAVKALMWGIEVESHMPDWIAAQNNTDEGRLQAFRSMAWAQWQLNEIASGEPFKRLLDHGRIRLLRA